MLDLLQSYSTVDPLTVTNEMRLLEAVAYLCQKQLLVTELPLA